MANLFDSLIPNDVAQRNFAADFSGVTPLDGVEVTPSGGRQSLIPQSQPQPMDQMLMPQSQGAPGQMMDQPSYQAPQNYDNSQARDALTSSILGMHGTGGSPNPGMYGLLPQHLQHGTLRNVLGALGDALLVGSGHTATYGPRMERQMLGQAMAGVDPTDRASVYAAAQRMAATGTPEGVQAAEQLMNHWDTNQTHQDTARQTDEYHQQRLQAQRESLYNRYYPMATADLARATNEEDYQARLSRWQARIHASDPTADVNDVLGVPEHFGDLEATAGMTGAQITHDETARRGQDIGTGDRAAQRRVSMRDTDVNAGSRIAASRISAGAHVSAAAIGAGRPSAPGFNEDYINRRRNGEPTTPEEDALFNHNTHVSQGRGRRAPPGAASPAPASAPAANPQGYAPHGHGATVADAIYLRDHPHLAAAYDARFGRGAAARALGHH